MKEPEVVDALILDLLQSLAERERSYEEVMSAWRTSCPKLPVWEDANDRGLVEVRESKVAITPEGWALLARKSVAGLGANALHYCRASVDGRCKW